jgi:branched-chain amino acid transport system substrate-binding protein
VGRPNALRAVASNQWLAGVVALVIAAVALSFALVRDDDDAGELASGGPDAAEVSAAPSEASDASAAPAESSSAPVAVPRADDGRGVGDGTSVIPGLTGGATPKPCTKRSVEEVGVTDSTITVGQVITDSNQIPQQFAPAHEGLEAFVKLFNDAGGLCGRKIVVEYRNDQLNPAIHSQDIRDLANSSIAFVGNESVLDQLDYSNDPPFEPMFQGGGSNVPDVGGLAFSYARSQSNWHAGVIGSVSPTLVGGAQYHWFQARARAAGKPCTKGAILYLSEPTGASEDQARVGQVSIEQSWGTGLGKGNTKLYSVSLIPPADQNTYASIVRQMADDGMDCVFSYTDLNSSIQLANAMRGQGYWPPAKCSRGAKCFRFAYIPFSAYDQKFIRDAGEAAIGFSTFVPHVPIQEPTNPAMRVYLDALKKIKDAQPSTFSVIGFASGAMFVEGLQGCAAAPTRTCLMTALRKMSKFTAGGLLGGTTPFRRTRATFGRYGTFDWKWIFNTTVAMRVVERNGKRDFVRINPKSGFSTDTIKIARGTPG